MRVWYFFSCFRKLSCSACDRKKTFQKKIVSQDKKQCKLKDDHFCQQQTSIFILFDSKLPLKKCAAKCKSI